MNAELANRINQLNPAEPYVWRLKLTEHEFTEIENDIRDSITKKGSQAHLLTEKWARVVIVYLAEWYKRRYCQGNTCSLIDLSSKELETIWNASGFSSKKLVYKDANNGNRWLYSIYVLGGLAIRHELGRNDKNKFFKTICKIYHNENVSVETLDSEDRAISFGESIKNEHSLYYYLQEILNGNLPFNDEELNDDTSEVKQFVNAIITANNEVLKDKFRFEWVITNIERNPTMSRRLILHLKPEKVGEGLHQYLGFDRVHLWGIENPENINFLNIGVKFLEDETVIQDVDWSKPLIKFINTGNKNTGFVKSDEGISKSCTVIPVQRFDLIQVLAQEQNGNVYIVQEFNNNDYLQLWEISHNEYTWTSQKRNQKSTTLTFTEPWELKTLNNTLKHKSFKDKVNGLSAPWNWYRFIGTAAIENEKGDVETFSSREGYYRVSIKLDESISYKNGQFVSFFSYDEEDEDFTESLVVPVFHREDIRVYHYRTKEEIQNDTPFETLQVDCIEFKNEGEYQQWTDENTPAYGKTTLRITYPEGTEKIEACYLPSVEENSPIVREYSSKTIRYASYSEEGVKVNAEYQDKIDDDFHELTPTVSIQIGSKEEYAEIDVWRPTLRKEIVIDNKVCICFNNSTELNLPYILKDRVRINDLSENGYYQFDCKNLTGLFTDKYLNIAGNPNIGLAAINAWENGISYKASIFNKFAPDFLNIVLGDSPNENNQEDVIYWNYVDEPQVQNYSQSLEFGVAFQNMKEANDLTCVYPVFEDTDPWAWDDIEVTPFKCYQIASQYSTYYFIMSPLRDLNRNDIIESIYKPLLELRQKKLTSQDKKDLIRFAEEMGFKWEELNVKID